MRTWSASILSMAVCAPSFILSLVPWSWIGALSSTASAPYVVVVGVVFIVSPGCTGGIKHGEKGGRGGRGKQQ
jgi:hypothetical protein